MGMIDKVIAGAGQGAGTQQEPPESQEQANPAEEQSEAPEQESGEHGGGKLTVTPQSVWDKLTVNDQQRQQLQRIVLAGKKVMFDQSTFHLLTDALKSDNGDLVQKLGTGITGLMALLIQESRQSIPGELVIPAGLILTAEAGQFLSDAGEQITDRDVADAMEIFVHLVLHQTGMDPEKMKAVGEQAGGAPDEASEPAAEESSETDAQEQGEQPKGLIGKAGAQQ